jgi:hypothetical protein
LEHGDSAELFQKASSGDRVIESRVRRSISRFGEGSQGVAKINARVAGAVITLFTSRAKRHLSTITKGLDQFDTVRKQIEAKFADERAKKKADLGDSEKQQNDAVAKVEQARAFLKAAEEEVATAGREVQESRSTNRIARVLEHQLNSKSYEQYLGIVAAIRVGFPSDLMKNLRGEAHSENETLRPIDRTVRCTDDLYRCPSDKVVWC